MEATERDGAAGARQPWERVGFFGPRGTFTEEAVLSLADLARIEHVPYSGIAEVLRAVERREVGVGVVPIENSIEGTVSATLDHLVFESDLLIQNEAVIDIHLYLMAPPGTALSQVRRVISFPHATAQCRGFLRQHLGEVELAAANSTADAARFVAEERPEGTAAIAPRLAADLYGLEILAEAVEDYAGNQTRFLVVAPERIPPPSGHDKTSIVCFQAADHPGSLHEILGQFAARSLNLTKIESRPSKQALGDYCFAIDLEGHLLDEVVGDCLKELHASLGGCKFLGSYPAAGADGAVLRQQVSARREEAGQWLWGLRELVTKAD